MVVVKGMENKGEQKDRTMMQAFKLLWLVKVTSWDEAMLIIIKPTAIANIKLHLSESVSKLVSKLLSKKVSKKLKFHIGSSEDIFELGYA